MTSPGSFWQESRQLIDNLLNRVIFSLWRPLAFLRFFALVVLFFLSWHFIAYLHSGAQPFSLKDALFLWPDDPQAYFFNIPTLRSLLPLLLPFMVMRFRAGAYLDDIFEIDDIAVAIRFIDSAVFGLRYDTIIIEQGELHRTSRNSPILRIGGPGFIKIAFDSAVVSEYIDCRPHVLTPESLKTGKTRARFTLDGFERLRSIYDLREHTVTFNVKARTQDGIPIEAQGLRLIFSLWRCGKEPSAEHSNPYPVAPQALISLTYNQAVAVGQPPLPLTSNTQWKRLIQGMISGQLRQFINHTLLDDLIATTNIDTPTYTSAAAEETTNLAPQPDQGQRISPRLTVSGRISAHNRNDFPNHFLLFSQSFNAQAIRNGVELHWNGTGAWVFPEEINKKIDQALEITQTNWLRNTPSARRQHRNNHFCLAIRNLVTQYLIHPYMQSEKTGWLRWKKIIYGVLILFQQDATQAYQALGQSREHILKAIANLKKTYGYFINEAASTRRRPRHWSTAQDAEMPQEERKLRQQILQFISQHDLSRALDILCRANPEASSIQCLVQLARCLADTIKEAAHNNEHLTPEALAERLIEKLERASC